MPRPITQRSFIRGLDASTSRFDQSKGTLPRISNLVMTRRGSLITCDGSTPLKTSTNQLNPTSSKGSIVSIQQFLPAASSFTGSGGGGARSAGAGSSIGGSSYIWNYANSIALNGYTIGGPLVPYVGTLGDMTNEFNGIGSTGIPSGTVTQTLYVNTFGFAIPVGATITGISVVINKGDCTVSNGPQAGVQDDGIFIVKGGVPVGIDHSIVGTWNIGSPTNSNYGGSSDLWDSTFGPADINDPSFGLQITAEIVPGLPGYFSLPAVAAVDITITYTGGGSAPIQASQNILYLQDPNPGDTIADVTGLAGVGAAVAGGTLNPATAYTYTVFALDGQQNSTIGQSVTVTPGGGNNAVNLSWNPSLGAGSYLIFQSVAGSMIAQVFQPDYSQNASGFISPAAVTYTDNGTVNGLTNYPYGTINNGSNNTIGALQLLVAVAINVSAYTYYDPVLIARFPCRSNDASIPNIPPVDASGGILGASGQVPQMIQFADVIVIGLGNGFRPQYTDGTTVHPITNTFTAQYANWAASTNYLAGDIVQPSPANGHIYICVQGGQSFTSQPAFPTGNAQVVVDNQVTWQENGFVTTSPAPRGAAHICAHAGSLWVFNTQPSNTADLLDGPSMLRMSDVDNINSWNPINAAYVGKDDGSEGMGLASFTISEFGIAPLGSLILFKNFLPYQVVGVFGAQDFDIQGLQSDMGATAPRSIKFMSGYGLIRLSHLGFAQLDGVRDRLISEQIRPYIFGSPNVGSPGLTPITPIDINHSYLIKSDQITNPPMYAAAAPLQGNVSLNRIFLFDLVLRAWTILDLPATMSPTSYISSLYQARTPGLSPVTMVGGFDDGSIQIIQNGVALWGLFTSTIAVNWAFTTPEVFNQSDPSAEVLVDNIIIRGTNLDGLPLTISVNLQTEGNYIADPRVYNVGTGEFELMIGINEQSLSANAIISGSGIVEIESVTWNVDPLPTGIPNVIT